jgi:L-ascorbate metabolism protein UlaG (beta-lactamase superfamily)
LATITSAPAPVDSWLTGNPKAAITADELAAVIFLSHGHIDHIGGGVDLGWVSVKLTPEWHTSTTPNGTVNTPADLLIEIGGKRIYNLGDTGLFSDLAMPKQSGHINLAIMPIGGSSRWIAVTQ